VVGGGVSKTATRRSLALLVVSISLAGCAANVRPPDQDLAQHGYWYHDANHPDGGGGQASPQAIYNATHGTWLWPPVMTDIPD
jgi:hypothetical protein